MRSQRHSESVTSRDLHTFLQKDERGRRPSLEEWLKPVIEEMDPDAAIEAQYKTINTDKTYVWRAKRLTFKHSLEYFCTLAKQDASLEDVAKQLLAHKGQAGKGEDGMVVEDGEEKREAVDEEEKEEGDKGKEVDEKEAVQVKIEANPEEDEEEGQLNDDDERKEAGDRRACNEEQEEGEQREDDDVSNVHAAPPAQAPAGKEEAEVGEKRKEMPATKTPEEASPSRIVKRRRVDSSPLPSPLANLDATTTSSSSAPVSLEAIVPPTPAAAARDVVRPGLKELGSGRRDRREPAGGTK